MAMARTSNVIRSLRSTNSIKNIEERYNFDVDEFEIDPTRPLKIFSRGLPKKGNTDLSVGNCETRNNKEESSTLHNLAAKTESITKMILEIEDHHLKATDDRYDDDMLPDDIYLAFHKKMLKQENRMLETELVQGENEAERLHLLYEKLDLSSWLTTLRKITVMVDPNNEQEAFKKKEQTQKYIKSALDKFENMKKRSNVLARNYKTGKVDPSRDWPRLYQKVDRKLLMNYHSSSDEDEEEMNAEEIKQHRRQRRRTQLRGSLIIQLTSNARAPLTKYAIISEPLKTPYVIRVTKDERKKWNKIMEDEPSKFEHYAQLPSQVAVAKRRVSLPLTLQANSFLAQEKGPFMSLKSESDLHLETSAKRISERKISSKFNDQNLDIKPPKHCIVDISSNIHTPPMRRKRKKQE